METEIPFLVYGVDHPFFHPAMLTGVSREASPRGLVPGSGFVLSGGVLTENHEPGDAPSVYMCGMIASTVDSRDAELVEDALIGAIRDSERVNLVFATFAGPQPDVSDAALAAGMSPLRAADALVITCQGRDLAQFHWHSGITGQGFELISSRDGNCPLQLSLASATKRSSVFEFMCSVMRETTTDDEAFARRFQGYTLYAGVSDPDRCNIALACSDTDPGRVEQAIRIAAAKHGFAVFRAEAAASRQAGEEPFLDYSGWRSWQPLPANWTRK